MRHAMFKQLKQITNVLKMANGFSRKYSHVGNFIFQYEPEFGKKLLEMINK